MTEIEISSLAKIENAPEHPMILFKEYLDEAENHLKETFGLFNLATCNLKGEVLNRTVVLRGHDTDGVIFVTERNSRKYVDIKDNPNVSATFLWLYHKQGESGLTKHQVRITGVATELTPDKIKEFYDTEPVSYKLRSVLCQCGAPVDWDDLKSRHDKLCKNYLSGKEKLEQNDSYTVLHIKATNVDFYHSNRLNQIADRVVYRLEGQKWRHEHVYA